MSRTYPLWPPVVAAALFVVLAARWGQPTDKLPPLVKDAGPLWADGERVTDARTGELMVWRSKR
jgi:hypothetical protein